MPKINYLILVFYSSTSYSILNSLDITLFAICSIDCDIILRCRR